jgi:hypothetical protein
MVHDENQDCAEADLVDLRQIKLSRTALIGRSLTTTVEDLIFWCNFGYVTLSGRSLAMTL